MASNGKERAADLDLVPYLSLIARHAPVGMMLADVDGCIKLANPRAAVLCGAPEAHSLEGKCVRRSHLLGALDERLDWERVLNQGEPATVRLSGVTAYGAHIGCDCTVIPLTHGEAPCEGLLILLVDVREEVLLQENLVQAEKLAALDNIVAGVTHELNNPLTAIIGYAELLLRRGVDISIRKYVATIAEEAERCRRVVTNLHSFSQRSKTPKSLLNVNKLLEETLSLLLYQLQLDRIRVETRLHRALPRVYLHHKDMQRVFLNLINNAQQALASIGDGERRLLVSSEASEGWVHISIRDSGMGISKENQRRIFDPFFTTRPFGSGLGLGLSMVYGIMQEHDGQVDVVSEPGAGAEFRLSLPIPLNTPLIQEDAEDVPRGTESSAFEDR